MKNRRGPRYAAALTLLLICRSTSSNNGLLQTMRKGGKYEPAAALAWGFVARGISAKSAFYAVPEIYDELFGTRGINKTDPVKNLLVNDLAKPLGSISSAVVMWSAAHLAYQQLAALKIVAEYAEGFKKARSTVKDLARSKLFDRACFSGMDAYYAYQTVQSLNTAIQKYSNTPTLAEYKAQLEIAVSPISDEAAWQKLQAVDTAVSFVQGLAASYLSFKFAEWAAGKSFGSDWADKEFRTRVFYVLMVFNIGISLTALIRNGYFAWKDMILGYEDPCYACLDSYKAGDDLAYIFTGVLPGFWSLYRSLWPLKLKAS